ncbi:unnamed protein product, partial [Choristocarpus tenellus]
MFPILLSHCFRHGMIMFGDADFLTSESVRNDQGRCLWKKFVSSLEAGGHIYREGLPVVCETHKQKADLPSPGSFTELAPDGGCTRACSYKLDCGHEC